MFKFCYCCVVCIVCILYLLGKCFLYIYLLLFDCVNEVDIVYRGWRYRFFYSYSFGVRLEGVESKY